MKYWVFENGDVYGPFPPQELMGREGFGPHSLICPEERGEDSSAWQEAVTYADFHFDEPAAEFAAPVVSDADKKDVFDEELNTLLEEKSPLISPEKVKAEEPAENLHFPAHAPSKPGPIEDYFNNIKGEDLGNILGIPDPNENSDMNLARALKSQFAQTQPPHSEEGESSVLDEDPFDAFTAKEDLNDKQESIEDDLAGVEPATQQAPVVLAGSPQEDTFHPKYRIRKKQDEDLLEKPVQEASPKPEETPAKEPMPPVPENSQAELSPVKEPSQEKKIKVAPVEAVPLSQPAEEPLPTEPAPAEAETLSAGRKENSIPLSAENPVVLPTQQEQTSVLNDNPKEDAPLKPVASTAGQAHTPTQEKAPQAEPSSLKAQEEPGPVLKEEENTAHQQVSASAKEEPLPQEEEDISSRLGLTLPEEPQPEKKPSAEENKEQTLSKEPVQAEPLPAKSPAIEPVQEEPAQQAPQQVPPSNVEAEPKESAQSVQDKPQEPSLPSLPQVPADDNPAPKALPDEVSPTVQKPAPAQDPVNEILQGAVDVTETPEVKEPIKEVAPVVDAQVNRVKPTLKKTAEIDKFLNEKIKEEKSRLPASKKIMWVLGFFIIILALLGLLWLLGQKPSPVPAGQGAPASPAVVKEGSAVEELVPDVDLDVPSAQEVLSSAVPSEEITAQEPQIPPQEKALQIVKEYELPNANGKIADYFDRIYKTKLAQGYSAVWSATPLHNNVYIVKYRISKTRLEPVVYLFQVDVAKNKLIGALNNITMDLVGKIN